jgi:hypothetical protein
MTEVRYLLDEHVDPRLRKGLKRRAPEITVWCIGDAGAPSPGTPDPQILQWCEARSFILVTDNRKTMPFHLVEHLAAGAHVQGVFVLGGKLNMGEIIEELLLVWTATSADNHRDQIRYLPVSR